MLDAGSALNHDHVLDRLLPRVEALHIVTLVPEKRAFTERGVSYVYEDLRKLPYRDGYFDAVACVSTLEHVGMDNRLYRSDLPPAADPQPEADRALAELTRVLTVGGRLFVTVPYGAAEDHGWFRQYDRRGVEALCATPGLDVHELRIFRYSAAGWQIGDLTAAAGARYRDYQKDPRPVTDRAAAARAVACLHFVRVGAP
jgi:SAM-dependent methyltransferase